MPRSMKIEAPKSLTEMVIARLEQAIVDGEFGLGEAISEETLAKAFGVSRTPVRDALSFLQLNGLVSVVSKKGSFVFEPTAEDTAMLCDYRLLLESEGLRLSHRRAKQSTRDAMRRSLNAMALVHVNDAVAYGRADTLFHQAFLDNCGNTYLLDAYRLASGKIAALRTHLTVHVVERRNRSFDEHAAMIRMFVEDDLGGLISLLNEHIDRTRRVYVEALSEAEWKGSRHEPA